MFPDKTDPNEERVVTWQGLNFKQTIEDLGYCYLGSNCIDWAELGWHPYNGSQMLFGNKVLRERYQNYCSDISTWVEDSRHMDKSGRWL